jgi:hypothetical protein
MKTMVNSSVKHIEAEIHFWTLSYELLKDFAEKFFLTYINFSYNYNFNFEIYSIKNPKLATFFAVSSVINNFKNKKSAFKFKLTSQIRGLNVATFEYMLEI